MYICRISLKPTTGMSAVTWSNAPEWHKVIPTPFYHQDRYRESFKQVLARCSQRQANGESIVVVYLYDRYQKRPGLPDEVDKGNILLFPVQLFYSATTCSMLSMSPWILLWNHVYKCCKVAHSTFTILPVDEQFDEYRSAKSARKLKGICSKISGG
jgi:hypothetical protein